MDMSVRAFWRSLAEAVRSQQAQDRILLVQLIRTSPRVQMASSGSGASQMDRTRRTALFSLAGASALAACAEASSQNDLTAEQFSAWLDRYGAAWTDRDALAAGALFSEDASYHEAPFDPPMQGRAAIEAYWARVTATQSDIVFRYDVIACTGDQGVAHWHAEFHAEGALIELDGVFVCDFTPDRTLVGSLREWWHVRTTP